MAEPETARPPCAAREEDQQQEKRCPEDQPAERGPSHKRARAGPPSGQEKGECAARDAKRKRNRAEPLEELPNGFKVFPVLVPRAERARPAATGPAPASLAAHYMYFKAHEARRPDPAAPAGRTLFVANVPADATAEHFRPLFRAVGKIESVRFHRARKDDGGGAPTAGSLFDVLAGTEAAPEESDGGEGVLDEFAAGAPERKQAGRSRKAKADLAALRLLEERMNNARRLPLSGGSFAHVAFRRSDAVEKALSMLQMPRVWGEGMLPGSEKGSLRPIGYEGTLVDNAGKSIPFAFAAPGYRNEYFALRPDRADLQASVDAFMAHFDAKERQARLAEKRKHNVVDEDGFVTVTRVGRRNTNTDRDGNTVIAVSAEMAKRSMDESRNKRKKTELVDFYRFQRREAKKNKLADLRKKFDQDKKKIEALKAQRRFKPY
ncbi:MAG: ribosomal RNA-processing protein 7-domain-containing protein [Olpidium bornovanus]|uniref:Ribosomal RNA-processing protein 7-domain-containing protein n=1 Tax=Olpidium bornovanus TaxID=278681 RepID=A0A8H7ZND0_9FUNG|nr:MAG: ribosomal RNA-processing protein 7-domain-containing protein [Olpidium bornovanus]